MSVYILYTLAVGWQAEGEIRHVCGLQERWDRIQVQPGYLDFCHWCGFLEWHELLTVKGSLSFKLFNGLKESVWISQPQDKEEFLNSEGGLDGNARFERNANNFHYTDHDVSSLRHLV